MAIGAPQPAVIHLVTLFRQISSGEVRIPAFQRAFVWRERQMVELLDSVLEGFPIGSVLLWQVESAMLKIAPVDISSFPAVAESYPTNYVLDGMQRLSTLYGVFHFGTSTKDTRFEFYYDLVSRTFAAKNGDENLSERSVPLSVLFTPRQLLEQQARLARLSDGDSLLDSLLALQAAFQDYMVPVVTIKSTDIRRIVGIFEKINSTGTRLDPVDFMRAITWAEDFDLNHSLDAVSRELSDINFELDAETVVKCVGMTLGLPPTSNGLLDLRARTSGDLQRAFRTTVEGIRRVAKFLDDHLAIKSSALVPYEGQLLVLFKAIGLQQAAESEIEPLVRWFWAIGFNESLRGKADHYVVRSVENWRGMLAGSIRGLEPRLKLGVDDLLNRRLVAGAALSTTFAMMHAAMGVRGLATGQEIEPAQFLRADSASWFEPILSRAQLATTGLTDLVSTKLLGNVIVLDEVTAARFKGDMTGAIFDAAGRNDWDTLASQFIDEHAVESLRIGDWTSFIYARVFNMIDEARQLVGDKEVLIEL